MYKTFVNRNFLPLRRSPPVLSKALQMVTYNKKTMADGIWMSLL